MRIVCEVQAQHGSVEQAHSLILVELHARNLKIRVDNEAWSMIPDPHVKFRRGSLLYVSCANARQIQNRFHWNAQGFTREIESATIQRDIDALIHRAFFGKVSRPGSAMAI